jgi:hypothetical protein
MTAIPIPPAMPAALPEFVSMSTLRRKWGVAPQTIRDMVRDGLLPVPYHPRHNLVLFERDALAAAVAKWPRTAGPIGWRRGATA